MTSAAMAPLWIKRTRHVAATVVFLGVLIAPFLVFGVQLEQFAKHYLAGPGSDGLAMVIAGLLLAGDPVLPTPSSVVATLLAAKVGFVAAAITNAVALSLACVFGYWLGRGGGHALRRVGRELPPGLVQWIQRGGLVAVLLCRPVPVLAEASLILAGAAGHEPRRLLAWCCATQVLLGTAYAYAGSGWGHGEWQGVAVFAGSVLIPLGGAAVVAASMLLSARRNRRSV
jgi:uncharacterized membrane protein YdjX (TVP38/TMEM64 family)